MIVKYVIFKLGFIMIKYVDTLLNYCELACFINSFLIYTLTYYLVVIYYFVICICELII